MLKKRQTSFTMIDSFAFNLECAVFYVQVGLAL